MQTRGAQSQRIHVQNTKVQETLRKKGQKDCKNQRIMEFSVRLCLLGMPGDTPRKSHQHDCFMT